MKRKSLSFIFIGIIIVLSICSAAGATEAFIGGPLEPTNSSSPSVPTGFDGNIIVLEPSDLPKTNDPFIVPSTDPTPTSPGNNALTITKHPTNEQIMAGTSTSFIAKALNATSVAWTVHDSKGNTIDSSQWDSYGISIESSSPENAKIVITNAQLSLSGWRFYATFAGANGVFMRTEGAVLTVYEPTPNPPVVTDILLSSDIVYALNSLTVTVSVNDLPLQSPIGCNISFINPETYESLNCVLVPETASTLSGTINTNLNTSQGQYVLDYIVFTYSAGYSGVYYGDGHSGTISPENVLSSELSSKSFSVKEAPKILTAPVGKELTFSGEAQELIIGGTLSEGEMQYSIDGETWETSIPTGILAGRYTIYYRIDSTNFSDDNKIVSIINPKKITLRWSDLELIYNGKEQKPTAIPVDILPADICDVIVTGEQINAGKYSAVAQGLTNNNYALPDDTAIAFEIKKAPNPCIISDTASVTSGGKEIYLSENLTNVVGNVTYAISGDANGCTIDPSTGLLTSGFDSGSVLVLVTLRGDDNYEEKTGQINVTIMKAASFNCEVKTDGVELTSSNLNTVSFSFIDTAEKDRFDKGESVLVWLHGKAIDSSSVPSEDLHILNSFANNLHLTPGKYYEISLYKQIGDSPAIAIHKTDTPINMTLSIPAELKNTKPDISRTFYLIRSHANIATNIASGAGTQLVGQSNLFSYYLLAYKDSISSSERDSSSYSGTYTSGNTSSSPIAPSTTTNGYVSAENTAYYTARYGNSPKTGDDSNFQTWICTITLSCIGLILIVKKRKTI